MTKYEEALMKAKAILTEAVLEQEENLPDQFHAFDSRLLELLRDVGQGVMKNVGDQLARDQEQAERDKGLTVQERKSTPFLPCSD